MALRRPLWVRLIGWAIGGFILALVLLHGYVAATIWWWRDHPPRETAFMSYRLAELRAANSGAQFKYRFVPYDRISIHLKRAMIAAEDAHFVDHEGFDWDMIQKAIVRNEKKGRVVAGASTISQQLAKNLFLSGERSWLRKGQEAIITWMLEDVLSKRRILELYLNVAEWGDGVFGAEAAARRHFGVPAAALSAEQAAWLAVILPSPRRYERGRLTPYLAGRVNTILSRMGAVQIP